MFASYLDEIDRSTFSLYPCAITPSLAIDHMKKTKFNKFRCQKHAKESFFFILKLKIIQRIRSLLAFWARCQTIDLLLFLQFPIFFCYNFSEKTFYLCRARWLFVYLNHHLFFYLSVFLSCFVFPVLSTKFNLLKWLMMELNME